MRKNALKTTISEPSTASFAAPPEPRLQLVAEPTGWSGRFRSARQWVVRSWDGLLLGLIILGIVGTLASMLLPRPAYELVMEPAPMRPAGITDTPVLRAGEETLSAEEAAPAATVKPRQKAARAHTWAKKAPPQVTFINKATQAEFQRLPGIGPALAGRILAYRKQAGGFKTIDEIQNVKGIGPKKFEKMKPYLKL
jgi:comEA protein